MQRLNVYIKLKFKAITDRQTMPQHMHVLCIPHMCALCTAQMLLCALCSITYLLKQNTINVFYG